MKSVIGLYVLLLTIAWSALDQPAAARSGEAGGQTTRWVVVDPTPAASAKKEEAEELPQDIGNSVHSSAVAETGKAAGDIDITYQGYFNRINATTVASVGGASFSLKEFYPERGLFLLRLEPLIDQGGLSAGENYARWEGLPWKGRHWDFALGDFHVNAAMQPLPFTNLTQPQFYLRGIDATASSADWRYSLYVGQETLSQGPRIPFRDMVPQMATGAEASTLRWKRLRLGFRYLHLAELNSSSGAQNPLVPLSRQFQSSDSLVAQSDFKITKGLEWYTEASWSRAQVAVSDSSPSVHSSSPFSLVAGPSWTTSHLIVHANYVRQSDSYLPLLGYFLGDREGTNVDAVLQLGRFGLSGSAGNSRNNLADNPDLPSFASRQASGGLQIRLPFQFTISGAVSAINLDSRLVDTGLEQSTNRQVNVALTKSVWSQNLRAAIQEIDLRSPVLVQQLRLSTLEDNYHWKHLSLGGAVRLQHTGGDLVKDSLFFRATGQFQYRRLSLYAYLEQGKDLANTTLFAKDTVGTSVLGGSWSSAHGFDIQLEALRNTSNTVLNAENVFVLASEGIPLNSTLSRFNNWSFYIRATQHFGWGDRISLDPVGGVLRRNAPLTGTLQGIVKLKTLDGEIPARGVWVVLDSDTTVKTDEKGYFEVLKVSEGPHDVALNLDRLPAEMNPSDRTQQSIVLLPEKATRVEFQVVPLQGFVGTIRDTGGKPAPEGIVVRLSPGDQYTTTDESGRFGFFNLPEGSYEAYVDAGSLPELSRLDGAGRMTVSVRYGKPSPALSFTLELLQPMQKPVQKLQLPDRKATAKAPAKAQPKAQFSKTQFQRKILTSSSNLKSASDVPPPAVEPFPATTLKVVYTRVTISAIE